MIDKLLTRTNRAEADDQSIDRAAAEQFLARLDAKAESWTFQTFNDNYTRKQPSLARILHGTLASHFKTLCSLNGRGAGVFVTVNETDGYGRGRDNIVRIRAVWQEDDGEGRPLPLEPHIVVETSPDKYHRYLLAREITTTEHQAIQACLSARYGSDANANDIARVLRVPGFFHRKGKPFRVRVVQESDAHPYERKTLLSTFPAQLPCESSPETTTTGRLILTGQRNTVLASLAGTMRRRGMSGAAIGAALAAENSARCHPPLVADEVQRIARSVARYAPGDINRLAARQQNTSAQSDAPTCKEPAQRESITDALIALVRERAELFHDSDGRVYATVEESGHRETWALDSRAFHRWVSATFYAATGKAPRELALKDALHTLAGIGRFRGETRKVWLRVGIAGDRYVLDLGNEDWQAVEVGPEGWRLLDDASLRFRRTATMRALPVPCTGGNLEALWRVLNVAVLDRPMILAWILECWRPETHTPVLELGGEQGSGKSETQGRLRDLIDPSEMNLRAAPARLEDIFISAHNNWLVSLNNLSRLRRSEQDALCVLSTGGGFATRTLYSNAEETVFDTLRPVVMNGISGLASAQDLVDRLIRVELPALKRRRASVELAREFDELRPALLGALLDLFSATLRELPHVRLENPPRMADFAQLGEAMFRALGRSGRFVELYCARQRATSLAALESSPVACAVLALMETTPRWSGPTKALLETLARHRQDTETWPRSPRGLGDALRRSSPALRLLEIDIYFDPVRHRDGYHVTVSQAGEGRSAAGDGHG